MRGVAGGAAGQHGTGGNPTRRPAHDFNETARAVISGHAFYIGGDFHDGGAAVFDGGTVAGAVVGVRQVVVNRLGDADDAHFVAALDGLLVDFMGGVLGIVAADVKEIADVVRLEDLEEAVQVARGLFGLFLEIELVAARAQRGRRGVLEAGDGAGLFLGNVNQLLVQHAEDAVEPAVNALDAVVFARFLHDACHAGVDDRGGAARLSHEKIARQFSHNFNCSDRATIHPGAGHQNGL